MAKDLMRTDLQEQLKQSVRDKFQELIDEKTLDSFVLEVTEEFQTSMKDLVKDILKEELKEYVKNYLKTKLSVEYDGNKTKYDIAIVNAIRNNLPDMFESMLGGMINDAMQNYIQSNRY